MWDNRCLLHRARPYDYVQPRVLIATRVAGALAAELALLRKDVTDRRYRGGGCGGGAVKPPVDHRLTAATGCGR